MQFCEEGTHDHSDHVSLKLKEFNHQNKQRELGGFPRRLLEPLRLIIHRPVFIVAIDGELKVKAEKAVRRGWNTDTPRPTLPL